MKNQSTHRTRPFAYPAALIVPFAIALPLPTLGDGITPPQVPPGLRVEAGNVPFLEGHGVGTQNYVCLPSSTSSTGFDWSLFTPQATLFGDDGKQLTTHFFGPDPAEKGLIRAAWQDSHDTSTVWAKLVRDPVFVTRDAIPWLLLQTAGVQAGPTGDTLTATTFIQRVNTHGGIAPPAASCSSLENVGTKAFVPYTADYVFYRHADAE